MYPAYTSEMDKKSNQVPIPVYFVSRTAWMTVNDTKIKTYRIEHTSTRFVQTFTLCFIFNGVSFFSLVSLLSLLLLYPQGNITWRIFLFRFGSLKVSQLLRARKTCNPPSTPIIKTGILNNGWAQSIQYVSSSLYSCQKL